MTTEVLRKFVTPDVSEIKALGEGRVSAILSTEAKDRDGDVIRAAGWDLKNFASHPELIDGHKYDSEAQIGHWEDVQVVGKQLRGIAVYYVGEGNARADWAYHIAEKGQAAYSVGFIPDMAKAKEMEGSGFWPSYEFNGQELLEGSHVAIPSNPQAIQRALWAKAMAAIDDGPHMLLTEDQVRAAANGDDIEVETLDLEAAIEMVTMTKELVEGVSGRIETVERRMDALELTATGRTILDALKSVGG